MTLPSILVVEDDEAMSQALSYNLEREGYRVMLASDGEEAIARAEAETPDFVLLDWMLPKAPGIEVCRRLRASSATRQVPILMLTGRDGEADAVRSLDSGADDYVVKPVPMSELAARIRAILRRARPAAADDVLTHGDITLDRSARRVRRQAREVHLTPTEFKLLDHLMSYPRRVFSRDDLLNIVWGTQSFIEARSVDVHVGRLRRALVEGGEPDPIRTVRSAGYALDGAQ